ncbi:hypothetical protein [Pseudomonas izuensis]|uniref:hypothetical protein n=1 Tax=Pseudomonas izuensis TaxID=2684212 RepID=UPI00135C1897|nr:hypothetical protein [Pseudomonas izuensis]
MSDFLVTIKVGWPTTMNQTERIDQLPVVEMDEWFHSTLNIPLRHSNQSQPK